MRLNYVRFQLATLLLAVLIFAPSTTLGQESGLSLVESDSSDWSQWRGPRRDGVCDETGLLTSWPEGGPERTWTASGIGSGYSSPIIADGIVYITGDKDEELFINAISLEGELLWQVKNGDSWTRSFPGARSSCTYNDGKLYHMNAHGRLVCLNADDGTEIWVVSILDQFEGENIMWGLSESLAILGDLIYATPCGDKGLVVALNKNTGETVWVTPGMEDVQPSYASPILVNDGERTLLINSVTEISFAVDAMTGELLWKVPRVDPDNTVCSIPVLADAGLVITNTSRGYGAVFGVTLNGSTVEQSWLQEITISHGSTVCVGGQVYGYSSRGEARGWVAIDAASGEIRVMSDQSVGSLIHADDRFYCLTERGTMTLQELTKDGFASVGEFQVGQGKDCWAHPVINDGKLYLRFNDSLFCYDIRR
jgi:outer membrane protein assembly factor BamB